MTQAGKRSLSRVFQPVSCVAGADGRLLFERRKVLPGWERVETTWYILEEGQYETFTVSHAIYSAVELRSMLRAAGFTDVSFYGSFAGDPFVGDARLHLVARAP